MVTVKHLEEGIYELNMPSSLGGDAWRRITYHGGEEYIVLAVHVVDKGAVHCSFYVRYGKKLPVLHLENADEFFIMDFLGLVERYICSDNMNPLSDLYTHYAQPPAWSDNGAGMHHSEDCATINAECWGEGYTAYPPHSDSMEAVWQWIEREAYRNLMGGMEEED